MANKTMIKCPNCGTFNTNRRICKNCNTPFISFEDKKALRQKKQKQREIEEIKYELENPNLVERLKKHPFFIYKIVGWILYSVSMTISIIGAGLAWFIAMVAAG